MVYVRLIFTWKDIYGTRVIFDLFLLAGKWVYIRQIISVYGQSVLIINYIFLWTNLLGKNKCIIRYRILVLIHRLWGKSAFHLLYISFRAYLPFSFTAYGCLRHIKKKTVICWSWCWPKLFSYFLFQTKWQFSSWNSLQLSEFLFLFHVRFNIWLHSCKEAWVGVTQFWISIVKNLRLGYVKDVIYLS